MEKGTYSVKKRIKSFDYAASAITIAVCHTGHNAWLHLAATIAVIVLALVVRVTATEAGLLTDGCRLCLDNRTL
jgi:diacylglycerol kinase